LFYIFAEKKKAWCPECYATNYAASDFHGEQLKRPLYNVTSGPNQFKADYDHGVERTVKDTQSDE
jgi:hypothetical protein